MTSFDDVIMGYIRGDFLGNPGDFLCNHSDYPGSTSDYIDLTTQVVSGCILLTIPKLVKLTTFSIHYSMCAWAEWYYLHDTYSIWKYWSGVGITFTRTIISDLLFAQNLFQNYPNTCYLLNVSSMFDIYDNFLTLKPLQRRHNGRDSVSNDQPHDCSLKRLFRRRSKKTSKLRVTGLCAGNSPVTGEFSARRARNAENISVWWRHHVLPVKCLIHVWYIWQFFNFETTYLI